VQVGVAGDLDLETGVLGDWDLGVTGVLLLGPNFFWVGVLVGIHSGTARQRLHSWC
jgi:hypothetical protein